MNKPPIIYVNSLAVRGFANGVVNLAFSAANFLPEIGADGKVSVTPQEEIVANLRMDLYCAQQVYDALGKIIQEQTTPTNKSEVN